MKDAALPCRPSDRLRLALDLAAAGERAILPHYQRAQVSQKADGSEVTTADLAAEEAIRDLIARETPHHGVLGEELGGEGLDRSKPHWIIDPLDGTTWFALGMPLFGTLIALVEGGEPVVGVIHFPVLRETVFAEVGSGCWFRSASAPPVRVRTAGPEHLSEAILSSSGLHASAVSPKPGRPPYDLQALVRGARKFRFCGDCMQHALVCRGAVQAAVDAIMQPWDTAALLPCLREAGAALASLSGRRDELTYAGSLVSARSEALLREVLATCSTGLAGQPQA